AAVRRRRVVPRVALRDSQRRAGHEDSRCIGGSGGPLAIPAMAVEGHDRLRGALVAYRAAGAATAERDLHAAGPSRTPARGRSLYCPVLTSISSVRVPVSSSVCSTFPTPVAS